jgi:hypothetical protein
MVKEVKNVKNCVSLVFSTPRKLRPKTCPLSVLDDFDEALVWRMFHNFCLAEKENAFVKAVHARLHIFSS